MKKMCFIIFFALLSSSLLSLHAQQQTGKEGRVLSVSGKTIIAQFEDIPISVGDEVEILRRQQIVDPVSGKIRGNYPIPVAQGVIFDFGLGKASLRVETYEGKQVEMDDIVVLTGKEKKITRPAEPRTGEIQEISDETIVTNLGAADDISPGDIFLIQRNEPVYDPNTKEVIGTNSVNVGRYSVNTVEDKSSIAKVIEQNLVPQKSDIVYKESEYLSYLAMIQSDSVKIAGLEQDVADLKKQLRSVRTQLDNLENSHTSHLKDYEALKREIDTVLGRLTNGDLREVRLRLKNDEPYLTRQSDELLAAYERALRNCLNHNHDAAVKQFNDIITRYPESNLTENCRYWIAQTYFDMKAYPQAAEGFMSVIRDTRFDHKDDDASIMLGITYFRMDRPDDARSEFERFIRVYPESEFREKIGYWVSRLPS